MRAWNRPLAAPLCFAAVGLAVLVVGPWPSFRVRGGWVTLGVLALLAQLFLSLFVMVLLADRDVTSRHTTISGVISMSLLGFGLAATASALLIGVTNDDETAISGGLRRSEVAVATMVLLVAAFLLVRRRGWYLAGWGLGSILAAIAAQERIVPNTDAGATRSGWATFGCTLVVVGLLFELARFVVRRRRHAALT